jgi:hypothetical protein
MCFYTVQLFKILRNNLKLKCLRVSKTESYGISRICFEMTRQATMPSVGKPNMHAICYTSKTGPIFIFTKKQKNCISKLSKKAKIRLFLPKSPPFELFELFDINLSNND